MIIILIYDSYCKIRMILDFNKIINIFQLFLELNEKLEIDQNSFKCLLFNISEIYPCRFDYIEKILNLIKNRIKPETLNGLCEYYRDVSKIIFKKYF